MSDHSFTTYDMYILLNIYIKLQVLNITISYTFFPFLMTYFTITNYI